MDGDFERLVNHSSNYKKMVSDYLTWRTHGLLKDNDVIDIIDKVTSGKMSTAAILDHIAAGIPEQKNNAEYENARNSSRIGDIKKYETAIKGNVTKYMDIGCGNGTITAAIGSYLGLKKENIIGVDVEQWAGHTHASEVSKEITFRPIKTAGELPIESNSIDFVSANMVFHHIDDDILMKTMNDIRRCMKDDGLFFLREHDSPNKMIDGLINIEHGLFQVALEKKSSAAEFQSTYYGKYKPMRDWINFMALYGFDIVGEPIARKVGTRAFIALFRKIRDAKTIDDMPVTSARIIARNMGIKSAGSLPGYDVKRAIVSGRRK